MRQAGRSTLPVNGASGDCELRRVRHRGEPRIVLRYWLQQLGKGRCSNVTSLASTARTMRL